MQGSDLIYNPFLHAIRIGMKMKFINFSYAVRVRQEQSLPRISSTTIYKDLTALHSPHRRRAVTRLPGDTGITLRIIALYERIRRDGSECGNPSKARDIEAKQKGEKSSSEVKRKASKSSWARKQKAENAAFDKALERGQLDECYRLRSEWMTASEPDREKERICHTSLWDEQGYPIVLWDHDRDLDECMYHAEKGRIRFFGEDGQVLFQEEWAKTGESCPGHPWYVSDIEQLSGGRIETTRRETK